MLGTHGKTWMVYPPLKILAFSPDLKSETLSNLGPKFFGSSTMPEKTKGFLLKKEFSSLFVQIFFVVHRFRDTYPPKN